MKNFSKIMNFKKKSCQNRGENFKNFIFPKKWSQISLFLCHNWILHVFCFHLMCILYMFVKNYDFSKIDTAKDKIFQRKTYLASKLSHYKITQHRVTIIDSTDKGRSKLSFETIYVWFEWQPAMQEDKNKTVLIPPRLKDRPKTPACLGIKGGIGTLSSKYVCKYLKGWAM